MLLRANFPVATGKFRHWKGKGHLIKDLKAEWYFSGQQRNDISN